MEKILVMTDSNSGITQKEKEKYGIEEEDFVSAEIEVVPAGKARDFGLDRSIWIWS